jgi:flagellar basal body-associated protein FliL
MADESQKEAQEAPMKGAGAAKGGLKLVVLVPMCLGVVILSSSAAALMSKLLAPASAAAPAPAESAGEAKASAHGEKKGEAVHEQDAQDQAGEYVYHEFPPIIVNPNTPRLERYVRATVVLAVKKGDSKAAKHAAARIEEKKPEMISWLTVYLAGCTLEELRGPKNLNRIRREVQEAFNDHLFRDAKPLIDHVLFKEIAIQ